eukprot:Rhum_TRINITY_DN9792_c0_g1::Rhum_TRINITY_DN9792_c0_g1_i1::g.35210::m.35210
MPAAGRHDDAYDAGALQHPQWAACLRSKELCALDTSDRKIAFAEGNTVYAGDVPLLTTAAAAAATGSGGGWSRDSLVEFTLPVQDSVGQVRVSEDQRWFAYCGGALLGVAALDQTAGSVHFHESDIVTFAWEAAQPAAAAPSPQAGLPQVDGDDDDADNFPPLIFFADATGKVYSVALKQNRPEELMTVPAGESVASLQHADGYVVVTTGVSVSVLCVATRKVVYRAPAVVAAGTEAGAAAGVSVVRRVGGGAAVLVRFACVFDASGGNARLRSVDETALVPPFPAAVPVPAQRAARVAVLATSVAAPVARCAACGEAAPAAAPAPASVLVGHGTTGRGVCCAVDTGRRTVLAWTGAAEAAAAASSSSSPSRAGSPAAAGWRLTLTCAGGRGRVFGLVRNEATGEACIVQDTAALPDAFSFECGCAAAAAEAAAAAAAAAAEAERETVATASPEPSSHTSPSPSLPSPVSLSREPSRDSVDHRAGSVGA